MKQRITSFLLIMVLCTIECLAGINKTLNEAQAMYQRASTVEQYQAAKKKFQSAKFDVGYVEAEHLAAINEGIRKCDNRISELSPRLTVNGNSSSTSIGFTGSGGTRTLSISTNQGTPYATALPSWITVKSISSSSITIVCNANGSSSSRDDWFNVNAGDLSVRVNVSQSAGRQARLEITGIEFANTNYDGDYLNSYGSTLYSADMRYLSAKITYNGPSSEVEKTVKIKIYKPDGTLDTGSSSPSGYTRQRDVTFKPGTGNTAYLGGWGNNDQSLYPAGTYTYEIWIDGSKEYSGYAYIYSRGATYLRVNGQSSTVNVSFGSDGGSRTFTISTDGDDVDTWGVPSFCSVSNLSNSSFTLYCEPNTSSSSRSDWMKIICGDEEVRINIDQDGGGPAAEIQSVTVDHNVFVGYQKGMKIHLKFQVDNMLNRKVTATAWFYYADNVTQLGNGYGGQVHVSEDDYMSYESSICTWTLFLPYTSLNMAPGFNGTLSFDVVIYDDNDNQLDRDENNTFTFSSGW